MKTPVQTRSEDTMIKMVDSALQVAAADGLAAVTIARVAKLSGCSNGALYHRFGNREGLLAAASDRLLTQIEAQMHNGLAHIDANLSDFAALRLLVSANRDLFDAHIGALRAFIIDGRNVAPLRTRGFSASQKVGREISDWLIERFGCTKKAADNAFRLLFASGALQIVIDDDTELSQLDVSREEAIDNLAEVLLLSITNQSK